MACNGSYETAWLALQVCSRTRHSGWVLWDSFVLSTFPSVHIFCSLRFGYRIIILFPWTLHRWTSGVDFHCSACNCSCSMQCVGHARQFYCTCFWFPEELSLCWWRRTQTSGAVLSDRPFVSAIVLTNPRLKLHGPFVVCSIVRLAFIVAAVRAFRQRHHMCNSFLHIQHHVFHNCHQCFNIAGKSFENYATCGAITNCHLEIKTSGRYT